MATALVLAAALLQPANPVEALDRELFADHLDLPAAGEQGRLKAVLDALGVQVSSQVLVFSRTSLQRHRIGPRTPRALYFADEVTVGYCQRGDVLEVAAADPHEGTAFYTLSQRPGQPARFLKQGDSCLICHGGSATAGLPGHLLRSVWPDRHGEQVFSRGSVRVDPSTPMADRWGGWYVTGTGVGPHRGNQVVGGWGWGDPDQPAHDRTDLKPFLHPGDYLSPHSDLVALLVLEHQADLQNRMTKCAAAVRQAQAELAELNVLSGKPAAEPWEGITRRIERACEPVVEGLLFCDETKLPGPVAGTSGFAAEFAARGPSDMRGRSLRQFDLTARLFRHPVSYLIYGRQFAGLPAAARMRIERRLGEVLEGSDNSPRFSHLSATDRRACLDILLATLPGLPGGQPNLPRR